MTNHRAAYDDLIDCSNHITVPVPSNEQRVEYLIDSIICQDTALQASIGLIRADTNNMRSNFELSASSLIEVDPYKRSNRGGQNNRQANISAIDFHGGRGQTGVDLRWHHPKEFHALSNEQKDELMAWLNTPEGKKHKAESKKQANDKKRKGSNDSKEQGGKPNSWKKTLKKKLKTDNGLATVMALLMEQEDKNSALVSAIRASEKSSDKENDTKDDSKSSGNDTKSTGNASALNAAMPATSVKLAHILKGKKK